MTVMLLRPPPSVKAKADAICAVLKASATAAQVERLSPEQWVELAGRAGVGKPSPFTKAEVLRRVREVNG